ncbi:hypothetical protein AB0L44_03945 [Nonomuraea wenchangensis]|uniref:hypothetical protein n=1 Tax=Nonomuraea wenchangensis TaxID=568860 RepID=UPI00342D4ACE
MIKTPQSEHQGCRDHSSGDRAAVTEHRDDQVKPADPQQFLTGEPDPVRGVEHTSTGSTSAATTPPPLNNNQPLAVAADGGQVDAAVVVVVPQTPAAAVVVTGRG